MAKSKKIFNIAELKTIHNFAATYKSKRGKVGVSRQYIESLIKRGKNDDFDLVKIDGIKFIYPFNPEELIDKDFENVANRTKRGKIIRPAITDAGLEVPFSIDQTTYDKEESNKAKKKKKQKEEPPENQLALF